MLFLSSVAHELRTPLNTIIPMSERLNRYITEQKGQDLLRIVINSAIHLENVVEDALDMSRLENNKFEVNNSVFNVRDVLDKVFGIMNF